MIRITTHKCPCGYIYSVKEKLKIWKIPTFEFGLSPVEDGAEVEELVDRKVLKGDEKFLNIFIYESDDSNNNIGFLACPKCGAILLYNIATQIEKIED